MHHLSFPSVNPIFQFKGLRLSAQVFTFSNVYEPDSSKLTVSQDEHRLRIQCEGFCWAGGQEHSDGFIEILITLMDGKYQASLQAKHPTEKIRCVKLSILDCERGKIANLRQPFFQEQLQEIDDSGQILRYPNGFEGLYTPLAVMQTAHGCTWFRSLDEAVTPKTFAFLPHENRCDVELIYEQNAREFAKEIQVPLWEFGFGGTYEEIMQHQTEWIARTFHLQKWEEREDVPVWARKISLVATMHCEHWTGYVFNTYRDIISSMKKIAAQVDSETVLIYLPGWEGRYYYQYGDFHPSERLGGADAFRDMIEFAHKLGMHVMPMFMINGANPQTEDFMIWGASSLYTNPSGYPQVWGSCDWDTSRHYDHNCGFPMNPAAPLWQDKLVSQVNSLIDQFHFDAVFMDLAAIYYNDRRFDVLEGTLNIAKRIRAQHPDVLMAGEGWYDALSSGYPLTQPSLTESGDCRWSDRPYPALFNSFNRCFSHLGTGDVSRGSTGVFESGYNFTTEIAPLRKGIIPTITIVDGTLENAPEKAETIFEQAREYSKRFIK